MAISRNLLLFFFLATVLHSAMANPIDSTKQKVIILNNKKVTLKEVASLPKKIKEASGLEITNHPYLWTHNDDGIPVIYCLDTLGNLISAVHINSLNRGWEDLAQDDKGNFYIGAFGNNTNDKRDLKIFKILNPETIKDPVVYPEVIKYTYADQKAFPPANAQKNFDVDALISFQNSLYLFSKNRTNPFTGYSKIYKLSQQPGEQKAEVVDSIFVGKGPMINSWITSADISPDKKTLALLFHDHIWLIRDFTVDNFSKGIIYQIDLNHYSHKAGICFKTNEEIYIVDELEFDVIGGKLYSLNLKPLLKDIK